MTPAIAFAPAARWISRLADAAAVIALAFLALEALFGGTHAFDSWMFQAAVLGGVACLADAGSKKSLPWTLVAYAAVACVSAAVHGWGRQAEDAPWFAIFNPALHLVIMAGFVFAASHTLRTPQRLAIFIVALSAGLLLITIQFSFDRIATGFVYNRMGSESLPSVAQWGGLHQIGLLLIFGLALTASGVVVKPTVPQMGASLVMCAIFLGVGYLTGSRSGILVMAVVTAWMFVAAVISGRHRWITWLTGGAAIAGALVLAAAILAGKTSLPVLSIVSGDRSPIWKTASIMAIENPLLGVGPGRYPEAIEAGYGRYLPWYPVQRAGTDQGHNAVLHGAAELGIPGAVLMVAFWWQLLAACRRGWQSGPVPLIACTLFVALGALFLRLMFDSLFEGVTTADRTRVLGGLLFAAAIAVGRLTPAREPSA